MRKSAYILALALAAVSCSTTRVLQEGEYRLAKNKVEILGNTELTQSDINPYIKQHPNTDVFYGWNPLVSIYNWSSGSGKGLDKVWEKIGVPPVVYSRIAEESSIENISTHLEYLGYYNSSVKAEEEIKKKTVRVKYIVEPGTRYRIDSIVFKLPDGSDEFVKEFEANRQDITVREGDFLSESSLEKETVRGAKQFNNLGFYDYNRNNYFFEADTLGGFTTLKYEIRDYTRNENASNARPIEKYRFGDVSISHSSDIRFNDRLLLDLNMIKSGEIYNEDVVNTTYNRLSSLKVFNGVGIELTPTDSATVDCEIRMSESSLHGLKADLEFSTNSSGLVGISPKFNWYHKNIFNGGEWLSLDFSSNIQFKPHTDIRSTEFSGSAGLSFPRFFGLPLDRFKGQNIPRTEIKASFSYQNRPEYRRSITSLSYNYAGSSNNRFFYQLYPFRANYVRLYDISDEFLWQIITNPLILDMFNEHIDMGAGGILYYTNNSDIVPKTPYYSIRFNFDLSGNLLRLLNVNRFFGEEYSNYVRGELNLVKAFRFGAGDGQALAARFSAGAGFAVGPESRVMPYEKMFYVGGASSMRGWQARTLGPGTTVPDTDVFLIPSQASDVKLEFDLEYRFKMFWKLEGAIFAETGNIWDNQDYYSIFDIPDSNSGATFRFNDFYKSLAADWGLGLRVNLDFLLLRFDLGMKLHDPSLPEGQRWRSPDKWFRNNGCAFHFGVGYPF